MNQDRPACRAVGATYKRLCWKGYASILRRTQLAPSTYSELAAHIDAGLPNVRRIVNRMHDLRLVHIAGWERRTAKGCFEALFAFGAGQDAPYPSGSRPGEKRRTPPAMMSRYRQRPELMAFAHIVRALAVPTTRKELLEATGATLSNLAIFLRHCKAIGLVRVAAWDASRPGMPAEALQIGDAPDAKRPKPLPRSEVQRRCRERRKEREAASALMAAIVLPRLSAAYASEREAVGA